MEHVANEKDGSKDPKLLKEYTLPLSGTGLVDPVITDLGVFSINKVRELRMALIELADGVTVNRFNAKT